MMNKAPAVDVVDLVVRRGSRTVLPGVSCRIGSGTVTGLLGPSGCGKSTLLRSVVGAQVVTSGSVSVLGIPAGSTELRHRVGYVTQAPSVYLDLPVREGLRYFAAVLGVGVAEVDRAIGEVGLERHTRTVAGNLSGGERARVSLAVALLASPEVLVLDEPTVGLDPVLRRSLWALFAELAAAGTTILVSSHVMDEAERCQRLLLMRDGRFLADAQPHELLEQTSTDTVEDAFLALIERDEMAA